VIVAPGQEHVISLSPEYISPQDGHEKQDCEIAAAKRWIARNAEEFESGGVTLLGDDLYSRQPMCTLSTNHGCHYIFVCLPESHKCLYDWLEFIEQNHEVQQFQQKVRHGRDWHFYNYRWVNTIPLRDTQPAVEVNWFELTITRGCDGELIYQNAWITDHTGMALK